MKKTITPVLLFFSLSLAFPSVAQYCGGSGPSVCTPGGPYSQLGFYPSYDQLPCAQIGNPFNQKVDMQIPATILYNGLTVPLNWVKIDTISNLPCGLCWASSNASNQFSGNSTGCVQISGTTYDAPGQYKLHVVIDAQANIGGFPYTLTNQDAESFGIKYYIRVQDLSGACATVDTFATGNVATVSGSATTPVITGNTSICSGQNTTLSISSANYYAYKWSTGAITSSITVNAGGTYTVTAYAACSSATASATVTQTSVSAAITASGPLNFCQGGSVTLTAPAGNDAYVWSDNSTGQSLTATQSGSYSVTVTHGSCTATDSKIVSVTTNNLSPAINPSVANICSGGTAILDAGSGYDTYTWSDTSTSSTIQTGTGGTYTVTVTQGTCSGTASATVNVGNFPVAVAISPAGPLTACDGDAVTLDAGSGYDGYSWSSTETAQTIQPTSSGTYIVTVMQNGCVGYDTVELTFNPLPSPTITPGGTVTICDGTTTLLDAGSGYSSYAWSNGSTTQSVVVSNTGNYSVTVTQNGCPGASSSPVSVQVNATPEAAITVVDLGGDGLMIAPADTGITYEWQRAVNDDTTAQPTTVTTTDDTLVVNCDANAGYYRVIMTNGSGCADTSGYAYIAHCMGISQSPLLSSLTLMPNPASDLLYVSYSLKKTTLLELNLTDLTGRIVKKISSGIATAGAHRQNVSIAELASGIYLVNLTTTEGTVNDKVVKQ